MLSAGTPGRAQSLANVKTLRKAGARDGREALLEKFARLSGFSTTR